MSEGGEAPAKTLSILVVDDHEVVRQGLSAMLDRRPGFQVVAEAGTVAEALDAARRFRPDLVVMDVRLSGERDGIDLAIELHRDHAIRCLFATAHVDAQARRRAEAARPLGWLQKPYTMASLVRMVRRALDLN